MRIDLLNPEHHIIGYYVEHAAGSTVRLYDSRDVEDFIERSWEFPLDLFKALGQASSIEEQEAEKTAHQETRNEVEIVRNNMESECRKLDDQLTTIRKTTQYLRELVERKEAESKANIGTIHGLQKKVARLEALPDTETLFLVIDRMVTQLAQGY